ncbi:ATP-binding cassette domain-containing protein [Deltaproteobacteria bacterium TL4]
MISVSNLSMTYGPQILFENVSLQFDEGKRYGIVGANGSGKTTILRLLIGEELPVSGEISIPQNLRLGTLKQDHFRYESSTVQDVVLQGKPQLWNALQEKEQLLQTHASDDETGHRLGQLEEIIASQDGYIAESFAGELLVGLGIEEQYHLGPMRQLSGGFKLRVLLAQLLFQEPEVLLLDEPTNHLDIKSIQWLESFLMSEFQGLLLFISHDRQFLNRVSTHIVDIDYETFQIYPGNYDTFEQTKKLLAEQKLKEIESQEKKIAQLQVFVDRFKAKATKARQAQSRVKQIEKIQIDEVKSSSRKAFQLQFQQQRASGKMVLETRELSKAFGANKVLKKVSFDVHRGEKVAIIGPNGIGKSTLLNVVLGNLASDHGNYQWGYETHLSYFAQDHHEILKEKASVYEWLYQFAPSETIGAIRGLLGRMLFSGDDVHKSVSSLSGGESARILFAKMVLEKGNVLVLDEPTNHLDLEGVAALAQALKSFEGTVFVVSHDRHFVSEVATHIIELTHEGAQDFAGPYNEYLERQGEDYLDRNQTFLKATSPETKSKPTEELSYDERKELKRVVGKLVKTTKTLESQIERYETDIAAIEQTFGSPDFFQNTPAREIKKLEQQKNSLSEQLSKTMDDWAQALELLEAAQQRIES